MRELHHFGIPTNTHQKNENYMAGAKLYVTDVGDSPNRIEWLRFEEGSPLPELLKTTAHIAYKIENLKEAMADKKNPDGTIFTGVWIDRGIHRGRRCTDRIDAV